MVPDESDRMNSGFEDQPREPIGEVLSDLAIHPLEDGDTAVEAFVMIKVRHDDGQIGWSYRTTRAPNLEELLGVLTIQTELVRRDLLAAWE